MLQTLDLTQAHRHPFPMASEPRLKTHAADQESVRVGRAFLILRSRLGLTQQQVADAASPPMSKQHYGMHETGRVPGIFRPGVQRRLIDALNAAAPPGSAPLTLDDIVAVLADGGEAPSSRMVRIAREVGLDRAVAERPADPAAAQGEATFPTSDGPVRFQYPDRLTAEGLADLEAYFATFLAAARRRIAPDN